MDGFIWVVGLSIVLGLSSFFVGILPLSFNLSTTHRVQLSTFGNGLLLGAALGVIIPEGIEAIAHDNNGQASHNQVALSLMCGFIFMLVVEQYGSHFPIKHATSSNPQTVFQLTPAEEEALEYDLEDRSAPSESSRENLGRNALQKTVPGTVLGNPLTLGLVMHSLADGLALGASTVKGNEGMNLSMLVFLALVVHKSPTALALSTSLLSMSLPRAEIRKHIAVFSLATPFGALLSFLILGYLQSFAGNWTGIAMLLSGGSFLYVATVIQPIGSHSHDLSDSPVERLGKGQRLTLLIAGVLLPFLLGSLIGHGHGDKHMSESSPFTVRSY